MVKLIKFFIITIYFFYLFVKRGYQILYNGKTPNGSVTLIFEVSN